MGGHLSEWVRVGEWLHLSEWVGVGEWLDLSEWVGVGGSGWEWASV